MRDKAFLGGLLAIGSVAMVAVIAACGSSSKSGFNDGTGNGGPGGTDGDGGNGFGTGTVDAAMGTPTVVAHLTGKVVAPEGTIPISGALVYLAGTTPPPIPNGVYCDKCVELTPTTPYTYSKPDGTFDLGAFSVGPQTLVVQKGQFRRAWPIQVAGPKQAVPQKSTTLPAKSDPAAGDDIPKMAVVQAQWDAIEVSLAKLGLGQIVTSGGIIPMTTVKNASFDIVDASLLNDATKLAQYNIVFAGCSFSSGTTCNTSQPAGDSKVQKNLQDYVAKGGKLYTSDYSYELMRQPWPGFVHWDGESSALGSACQGGSYDAQAQNIDPGLSAWLTAIGEGNPTLKQSWTSISSVSPQMGTDQNGKPAMITPKVWLSGNNKPMTVSFQSTCGRVLFSTYHTEGDGASTLLAQEKALLYVLLEVGVCVGTLPPPK